MTDPRKAGSGPEVQCYRCGATLPAAEFDRVGWVVKHAFDDGAALFICPRCQASRERELARDIGT